ncbi:MAG: hypothetical protein RIR97_48 [Pseudomonadota bacterium]
MILPSHVVSLGPRHYFDNLRKSRTFACGWSIFAGLVIWDKDGIVAAVPVRLSPDVVLTSN